MRELPIARNPSFVPNRRAWWRIDVSRRAFAACELCITTETGHPSDRQVSLTEESHGAPGAQKPHSAADVCHPSDRQPSLGLGDKCLSVPSEMALQPRRN